MLKKMPRALIICTFLNVLLNVAALQNQPQEQKPQIKLVVQAQATFQNHESNAHNNIQPQKPQTNPVMQARATFQNPESNSHGNIQPQKPLSKPVMQAHATYQNPQSNSHSNIQPQNPLSHPVTQAHPTTQNPQSNSHNNVQPQNPQSFSRNNVQPRKPQRNSPNNNQPQKPQIDASNNNQPQKPQYKSSNNKQPQNPQINNPVLQHHKNPGRQPQTHNLVKQHKAPGQMHKTRGKKPHTSKSVQHKTPILNPQNNNSVIHHKPPGQKPQTSNSVIHHKSPGQKPQANTSVIHHRTPGQNPQTNNSVIHHKTQGEKPQTNSMTQGATQSETKEKKAGINLVIENKEPEQKAQIDSVSAIQNAINGQNSPINSLRDMYKVLTLAKSQAYINAHNAFRLKMGVPILQWDKKLEEYAHNYASKCANACSLQHSNGPFGENIFWEQYGESNPADIVKRFTDEQANYDIQTGECRCPPDSSKCMCGHFTAVVWKSTERVGCAETKCIGEKGILVVCSYDPPGNIKGQNPLNPASNG